jgi:hypothetical protein
MTADRAAMLPHTEPPGPMEELDRTSPHQPETVSRASSPANLPQTAGARPQRPASPETLRLYAADWAAFEDWCGKQGVVTLPADVASVAGFLTEGASTLSVGALTRRAAAIAAKHREKGFASPAADPAITAILRLARRDATPRRAPRKTPATLIRMALRCQRDLAGMRDRALLLLAACGLGRAALVGLDVEHIRFTMTAAELSLDATSAGEQGRQRGKRARQEQGRGDPVVIDRGAARTVCPVQALRDWLDTSNTQFGPVFRKIDRWGTLEHHRLGTDAIRRILVRRGLRRHSRMRSTGGRPRKGGAG